MSVRRIFVEKKPAYAVKAGELREELESYLGIDTVENVRVLIRYDIENLSEETYGKALVTIFSEPPVDEVYEEEFPKNPGDLVFSVEYLPGQFDQRADSAEQCVKLLKEDEEPVIRSATTYVITAALTPEQEKAIKAFCINPVDSREAGEDKPSTLVAEFEVPEDIKTFEGFAAAPEAELKSLYDTLNLAMTFKDFLHIQRYFRDEERRDPTVTEIRVLDTYWSDHCRHTTFSTELKNVRFTDGDYRKPIEDTYNRYLADREVIYKGRDDKYVCLMDLALMAMKKLKSEGKLEDMEISDEINACSIVVPVEIDGVTEEWLVNFKNETHNHPTEIEPFGGAATCLGGAIRDPLSGRAYVYQAMRVTGSGDPTLPFEATMPGKLPTRKITTGAAHGYSSYGNQIGLATGQVTELYDPGYAAKRMEIGAVIGASPKENVIREVPAPGDAIVLLGGRTGRDGCGGATGSSKAHTEQSIETCGAEVQKGNPPTERKIQRLFRKGEVARLIKRCNDFGAGGVCVAIGELADGLTVDLDKVTKKYEGLDGTELAISESQERMAVVLDPKDVDAFIQASREENLEATWVATVTEEPRLTMNWRGDTIVNLSRAFLNTNGVTQVAKARITAVDPEKNYRHLVPEKLRGLSMADAFTQNLSRLEVCSQKGLSERFDSSIGAATVLMPFAGRYQLTPEEAMVAKIPLVHGETDDATAMSYGYIPGVSRWSPFHGAAYAVVESLSKLAAVGADPLKARLTFQEYFERLHDVPERWGKPAAALLGAFTAQVEMGIPSIGGKDSMSGSFEQLDVPPTLVSFAVDMTKASDTVSAAFQSEHSTVVFVPVPENQETLLPDWEALKEMYRAVRRMMEEGSVRSANVVREGGAAAAVARSCFGNQVGFAFRPGFTPEELFAPLSGGLILELSSEEAVPQGIAYKVLGETRPAKSIALGEEELPMEDCIAAWTRTLEKVFPTKAPAPAIRLDVPLWAERSGRAPAIKAAKPRVFIPAFPGTNCEIDTARAFEKAGAIPEILVVKNLTPADIEETIERMAKAIEEANIVMIPGGFSGGDEPDGSGKFIATTFRNPRVAEQVTRLLEQRDGLMLGICNGFQALIKLGLLPYGKITNIIETDPTLTFNTLGRPVSRMVYTRVTSVKSPWFSNVREGDVFAVPVSHGEGRFVADDDMIKNLMQNGQIATQYVTPEGVPSSNIAWNPNGSVCAVEGITSPDGRILGKMGHTERKGDSLYRNVPGKKDPQIFEAGVAYFK